MENMTWNLVPVFFNFQRILFKKNLRRSVCCFGQILIVLLIPGPNLENYGIRAASNIVPKGHFFEKRTQNNCTTLLIQSLF